MSTYRALIEKALASAQTPAVRAVAQATACALRGLAPSKPYDKVMLRELVYRENDIGEAMAGYPDLDAEAPADLFRIVWNSCNTALRLAKLK